MSFNFEGLNVSRRLVSACFMLCLCPGMVYMSSSALDWHPILEGWLNHRPPTERKVLMELFEGSFTAIYTYVWQSLNPRMETLECNYIRQVTTSCSVLKTGVFSFHHIIGVKKDILTTILILTTSKKILSQH